jgi:hypothetical protein
VHQYFYSGAHTIEQLTNFIKNNPAQKIKFLSKGTEQLKINLLNYLHERRTPAAFYQCALMAKIWNISSVAGLTPKEYALRQARNAVHYGHPAAQATIFSDCFDAWQHERLENNSAAYPVDPAQFLYSVDGIPKKKGSLLSNHIQHALVLLTKQHTARPRKHSTLTPSIATGEHAEHRREPQSPKATRTHDGDAPPMNHTTLPPNHQSLTAGIGAGHYAERDRQRKKLTPPESSEDDGVEETKRSQNAPL